MKATIITGSFPPDICGVGDYTACLLNTQEAQNWKLLYTKNWKLSNIKNILNDIKKINSHIIIFQYPTMGYKWSLSPQLLCLYYTFFTNKKTIVVLHELSQRTIKAKIATIPFLFANRVIFTNQYEKEYASKLIPWNKPKYKIVKIYSNISAPVKLKNLKERDIDLVYFGHIRPNKGIEDFLEIVIKCKTEKSINACIVGQIIPEYKEFYIRIQDICEKNNINIQTNKAIEEVTNILNRSKIALLPFPDGLSERRGTLLAALASGCSIFSYAGKYTTKELQATCIITKKDTASHDIISYLENITEKTFSTQQDNNLSYLKKEFPLSWEDVVKQYKYIINNIKL